VEWLNDTSIIRSSILTSVRNPFKNADTMVLDTEWEICGYSEEEEIHYTFDTKIDSPSSLELLSKKLGLKVITLEAFYKQRDSIIVNRNGEIYGINEWQRYQQNKIQLSILAEVKMNKIYVNESFTLNKSTKNFSKVFFKKDGKWTYKII